MSAIFYFCFIRQINIQKNRFFPILISANFTCESIAKPPQQSLQIHLMRMLILLPQHVVFHLILQRRKFSEIISNANSRNAIEHKMRGLGKLSAPRNTPEDARLDGLISVGNRLCCTPDPMPQLEKLNVSYEIGSTEVLISLTQLENVFRIEPKDHIYRSEGAETGVDGDPMITVFRKPGAYNTIEKMGSAAC